MFSFKDKDISDQHISRDATIEGEKLYMDQISRLTKNVLRCDLNFVDLLRHVANPFVRLSTEDTLSILKAELDGDCQMTPCE